MGEEREPGEIEAKSVEDLVVIAEEYLAEERYEDAIKVFKEIVKREPTLPLMAKTCNDCGVAYASMEQYEMAMGFFTAALNLRAYLIDEGISAYLNLGQVYKLVGDEEKAEECFRQGETLRREHKRRDDEARRMLSSIL
ncbi:MAG: tetratricopeptide repeat-containing protein [Methanophagales archaeon ANME-1-THS]|nr:MAG: tetratricopeptide repeat-containing protein [Methanophagales archaeon ANME-1-THS]